VTSPNQLQRDAAALVARLPTDRAEAMVFCLGFLDQAVKCYLRGDHTHEDLARNRELVELTLDLHRDQRG
jgi:hypothetical protein